METIQCSKCGAVFERTGAKDKLRRFKDKRFMTTFHCPNCDARVVLKRSEEPTTLYLKRLERLKEQARRLGDRQEVNELQEEIDQIHREIKMDAEKTKDKKFFVKGKDVMDEKSAVITVGENNWDVVIMDGTHIKMSLRYSDGKKNWGIPLHINQLSPDFINALKAKGLIKGNFFVEDSKTKDSLFKGQKVTAKKSEQGLREGETYTVLGEEKIIKQIVGEENGCVYKLQDSSGNVVVVESPKGLFYEVKDAVNYMGERSFQTYEAWKRACKQINPNVIFEGDKDICQAKPGIGEWDGAEGIIYNTKTKDEVVMKQKVRDGNSYNMAVEYELFTYYNIPRSQARRIVERNSQELQKKEDANITIHNAADMLVHKEGLKGFEKIYVQFDSKVKDATSLQEEYAEKLFNKLWVELNKSEREELLRHLEYDLNAPLKTKVKDVGEENEKLKVKIGDIKKNMDAARKMGYDTEPYQKEIDKLETKTKDDNNKNGYYAGITGKARTENPFTKGTPEYVKWDSDWKIGNEDFKYESNKALLKPKDSKTKDGSLDEIIRNMAREKADVPHNDDGTIRTPQQAQLAYEQWYKIIKSRYKNDSRYSAEYGDSKTKDEDKELSEALVKDAPDYYGAIVATARRGNNPRMGGAELRKNIGPFMQAHGVQFNEEEFNKAYKEFSKANVSKSAFMKGTDAKDSNIDSKTKDKQQVIETYKDIDIIYDDVQGRYWAMYYGRVLSIKDIDISRLKRKIDDYLSGIKDSSDIYTKDPLTKKGQKILAAMKKTYGEEKGEQIFYASKNKGKISGVDAKGDVSYYKHFNITETGMGDFFAELDPAIAKSYTGKPYFTGRSMIEVKSLIDQWSQAHKFEQRSGKSTDSKVKDKVMDCPNCKNPLTYAGEESGKTKYECGLCGKKYASKDSKTKDVELSVSELKNKALTKVLRDFYEGVKEIYSPASVAGAQKLTQMIESETDPTKLKKWAGLDSKAKDQEIKIISGVDGFGAGLQGACGGVRKFDGKGPRFGQDKKAKDALQEGDRVKINYGVYKGKIGKIKELSPSGQFAWVTVSGTKQGENNPVSYDLSDLIKVGTKDQEIKIIIGEDPINPSPTEQKVEGNDIIYKEYTLKQLPETGEFEIYAPGGSIVGHAKALELAKLFVDRVVASKVSDAQSKDAMNESQVRSLCKQAGKEYLADNPDGDLDQVAGDIAEGIAYSNPQVLDFLKKEFGGSVTRRQAREYLADLI